MICPRWLLAHCSTATDNDARRGHFRRGSSKETGETLRVWERVPQAGNGNGTRTDRQKVHLGRGTKSAQQGWREVLPEELGERAATATRWVR